LGREAALRAGATSRGPDVPAFQLATDIIESARAPNWEDIGRLAAIAVIRTFLNYFLERDIKEAHSTQAEGAATKSRPEAGVMPQR